MRWIAELLEEHPLECYIIVCLLAVGLILLISGGAPSEFAPDCEGTYTRVNTDGSWVCHDSLEEF